MYLLEACWLVLIAIEKVTISGKINCKESYNGLFRLVCMHVANTCRHLHAKRIDGINSSCFFPCHFVRTLTKV